MRNKKPEGIAIGGEIMWVEGEWWAVEHWKKLKDPRKLGKRWRKWFDDEAEMRDYVEANKQKWLQAEVYRLHETDDPEKVMMVGVSGKVYEY